MVDFLEYSDISAEVKGYMTPGRLKMTDQQIVFKNNKTGKVEQINATDMEVVNVQRFIGTWGLRIFLRNGTLHRFSGFKSGDEDKIMAFFKTNYKKDLSEKEFSLKGWNWGTANFGGSVLSFDMDARPGFEIPLNHVSQSTTGKNEVTLEFHQNDDAPVSLMEMRFHIPANESSDIDPVDAFHQNVLNKASVISVSGDAIAIFREIHCLTPRGRYDIKIFQTFFQLHGKTFDYKIPMSTVLRLFLLPHKDNRQMFFVLSLDPPIKQGQTRYHFLVLLFGMEEETSIELPFSENELKEKYEDKLTKELSGPVYEVLGKIMKVLINRKLTGPGSFVGHSGTPAIGCSFKAAAGYLYPLERGFIYVHKPPIHIRFDEIASVNFARSGGSTRSFDFEIELRSGTIHTFSSIEKEEYNKLFDFISSKKIQIKNTGKNDKASYKDDFGDSENENDPPDAYLARVKAEAEERSDDGQEDSDESTDEDFNPDEQADDDVADEYDSNVQSDSSESSTAGADGAPKKEKEKKREKKKERKEKPERTKKKKERDSNKPKRPNTAFFIWLNENRDKIRKDDPSLKITEVTKKAGEMWKELTDKTEWEAKAGKEKEKYVEAMKVYNESGGGNVSDSESKGDSGKKRKKDVKNTSSVSNDTKSPKKSDSMAGGGFKSKEYISDDESSDDSGGEKKNKKAKKSKPEEKKSPVPAKKKDDDDDEDDEEDDDVKIDEDSESDKSTEKKNTKSMRSKKSDKSAKEEELKIDEDLDDASMTEDSEDISSDEESD